MGMGIIATGGTEKCVAYGLLARPGKVRGAAVAATLAEPQFLLWLVALVALVALVLLLTPTGRLPSPRWRPVAWTAVLLPPITYVVMVLAPRQLEASFSATPNVLAIEGL